MTERKSNRSSRPSEEGWWSREHASVLALFAVTTLALYLCYLLARPFLSSLAWALALAIVAHPLYERIAKRIRHENIAAGLAVVIVAITIVAPTILIGQQLVQQAGTGLEAIKKGLSEGNWQARLDRSPLPKSLRQWIEKQVDLGGEAPPQATTAVASGAKSFVKGSVRGAMELLVTFFILFYFFRDGGLALKTLRSLLPLSNSEADEIFQRVTEAIQATIFGTLFVAAVQGTLGGLMFWWLGLPTPLLWGVAMALLAIVPVLGAFVVWIPAAIYFALHDTWIKALVLTAWGGGVIGLIDNLLYPILVGKRMRLHTLPVFISIVGGLSLFGASGLILGPMALAVTMALLDFWRWRTAGGRAAEDGL
jgi:predicted PurR-regulated permease PerM